MPEPKKPVHQTLLWYFLKAVFWFASNLLYGLAPFLLIQLKNSLSDAPMNDTFAKVYDVNEICGLLFIFCVLLGAATVDFILAKKINLGKHISVLILGGSGAIFVLVCLVYIILSDSKNINWQNFNVFKQIVITFSTLYCISVKTLIFKLEE